MGMAALLSVGVQSASAAASTYYVDPDGSDAAAGTSPEAAWKTVARVNNSNLQPGDRVLFEGGGVWRETLEPRASGTAEAPITFSSYGEGRPMLDGQGAPGFAGIVLGARSHLSFEGFEVRDYHATDAWKSRQAVYLAGPRSIRFDDLYLHDSGTGIHTTSTAPATDITVQDSAIRDARTRDASGRVNGGIGINVTNGSTGWTVRDTEVENAGDSCIIDTGQNNTYEGLKVHNCGFSTLNIGQHGLYLKGPGHILKDSEVFNTRDSCVSTRYEGIRVGGNRLHGCQIGISWFENTGKAGEVVYRRNEIWDTFNAIYVDGSATQDFHISNNTMLGARPSGATDGRGIYVKGVPGLNVENNVVTGAIDIPLFAGSGTKTYVERANTFHSTGPMRFFWNGSVRDFEGYRTASEQGAGSTTSDPELRSSAAEAPDFGLLPTSPAIDAGVTDPASGPLTPGCDGAPDHYCGAAPDMGARETTDTTPPGITLPQDITEEATGEDGAMASFAATATDDIDGEVPANCASSTGLTSGDTFPIGTTTVNCSAKDSAGNETSGGFEVTVRDTTPPVISGVPSDTARIATGSSGAVVSYSEPTATDVVDGTVPVDCSPPSGTKFALGTTRVDCAATDSRNNTAHKDFEVAVSYSWSGVLQPVNADGDSVFRLGSTVPVKFRLTGESAGIADATARLYVAKISDDVAGDEVEAGSSAAATTGNLFRYDATGDQYVFNWSTKGLDRGTYQLRIGLGDGTTNIVRVSLR